MKLGQATPGDANPGAGDLLSKEDADAVPASLERESTCVDVLQSRSAFVVLLPLAGSITREITLGKKKLDAQCRASSAPLRDLLDAPTALAACCGFDLCHKYILYLYLYLYFLALCESTRSVSRAPPSASLRGALIVL